MTIKETLFATIVAHILILMLPKVYNFFKGLSTDNVEIYKAIKAGDKNDV